MPIVMGLTAGGVAVPVLVDADGKVQTVGEVTNHNLLDGDIIQDSEAYAVQEGAVIAGIDQGGGVIKWTGLGVGADGQVLTVQSDGSLAWETPDAGGGMTRLAQTVVGAGGAASVDFTSISQDYDTLIIDYSARSSHNSGVSDVLNLTCNNISSAVYDYVLAQISNAGLTVVENFGQTALRVGYTPLVGANANFFAGGRLIIPNYTSANIFKSFQSRTTWQYNASTGNHAIYDVSLHYKQTTAISRLTFSLASGNFVQYSTFSLFGV